MPRPARRTLLAGGEPELRSNWRETGAGAPVAAQHARAELDKFLVDLRRAGVMRGDPALLRGEAEGDGHVEGFEDAHHPVEPGSGIRAQAVGPGQPGAEM